SIETLKPESLRARALAIQEICDIRSILRIFLILKVSPIFSRTSSDIKAARETLKDRLRPLTGEISPIKVFPSASFFTISLLSNTFAGLTIPTPVITTDESSEQDFFLFDTLFLLPTTTQTL